MAKGVSESRDHRVLRHSNSLVDAGLKSASTQDQEMNVGSPRSIDSSKDEKTKLKNKLQDRMIRRNASLNSRKEMLEKQQSYEESVKEVQIIVEDVEKKIEKMQLQNNQKDS